MNSIRPLATITLLAVAGVYLYFKINENEPQLPTDVADWTLPAQVDIHEQPVAANRSDVSSYPSPAFAEGTRESQNFASAAPFPPTPNSSPPVSNSEQPANNFQAAAGLQAAPGFQAASVDTAGVGHGTEASRAGDAVSADAARAVPAQSSMPNSTLPDLPPLPEIPEATRASSTPPTTPPIAREVNQGVMAENASRLAQDHSASQTQRTTEASSPDAQSSMPSPPQASLFGATRLAVQGALDRASCRKPCCSFPTGTAILRWHRRKSEKSIPCWDNLPDR